LNLKISTTRSPSADSNKSQIWRLAQTPVVQHDLIIHSHGEKKREAIKIHIQQFNKDLQIFFFFTFAIELKYLC
jgi:hypothetical protein